LNQELLVSALPGGSAGAGQDDDGITDDLERVHNASTAGGH
jgi:hypothetical protein